jgi:ABC-type lipoprotein export system ATPase subunit
VTVAAAVAAPEEVAAPLGLRLESVSKRYDTAAGTIDAVQDVDLVLAPGRSLAVMGPSG